MGEARCLSAKALGFAERRAAERHRDSVQIQRDAFGEPRSGIALLNYQLSNAIGSPFSQNSGKMFGKIITIQEIA
jgi:hypothetical protein